jgi:hypothetical protein
MGRGRRVIRESLQLEKRAGLGRGKLTAARQPLLASNPVSGEAQGENDPLELDSVPTVAGTNFH